jgi:DNA-binding HxlR family transcriptional regulator
MKRTEHTLASVERILARNPDAADAPQAAVLLRALIVQMAADGNPGRKDPMREILARLGDKWSPLLLLLLRTGSFRHATLRRLVGTISAEGNISQRMFTLRLRALERDGLIARRVISTVPAAVMYSLSDAGRSLVEHLDALLEWTRVHGEAIRAAQLEFSAASG